jgi:predicted RNA binding protein YcfA (HicA-like mRNA interferase family)
VEGSNRKLAVECDGEKWHTPDQLQNDLERQAILERLGWIFVRIRGSVFFRNPDAAMTPVFAKLADLEIETLGHVSDSEQKIDSVLIERVRRNAEALRTQWLAEEAASAEVKEEEFAPF